MKKKFCLTLSIFLSTNAMSTTMEEALSSAYQTNPDLIAAREELKKTDELMYKAISGFLPKLDYEAREANSKTDTKWVGIQLQKQDQWINTKAKKTDLTLEQNIFSGGRSIIAIKMAKYTIESGRAALISKEQEVLLKAITAYLDLVFDKEKLEIHKDNVKAYQLKYQSVKNKLEAGFAKPADLANALSKKSDAETSLAEISGKYISSQATYLQVIGLEASDLSLGNHLSYISDSQMDLLQKSLKNNPELVKAIYNQKAADLNVKYNAAALLPSIDLGGKISKLWENDKAKSIIQPYSNSKSIYVSVKVPIYNKGVEYSNIRYSNADAAKFKYQLKNTRALITKQATQAWNNYLTAQEMVNSSKQAVSAGVTALLGKQKEYNEGQISLTELLDMQESLFKYKLKLADVTKDFQLKLYYMDSIMGSLTAKDLKLPTAIYNPVANYDKVKYQLIGF